MKSLITTGALSATIALALPAAAATLLQADFTSYADLDAAKADGWSQTTRNGRSDALLISPTAGLQNNGWKQSTLNKALTGTVDLSTDNTYTIEYRQYVDDANRAAMFALTSAGSSLVVGQSYDSNPGVYIGDAATNVLTSSLWYSFQDASGGTAQIATDSTASSAFIGSGWANFQIVIQASSTGANTMTVNATTDGGMTGDVINGHVYSFTSSDVFDGAGFLLEGPGTSAVAFSSVSIIPEPSTTALLGLGGLALVARRRRK